MAEAASFRVPDELDGERIDRIVAVAADVSRSAARDLVESGAVSVGDRRPSRSDRVKAGETVDIVSPMPSPYAP